MIFVEIDVYTAANGRESVLKSEDELIVVIGRLKRQIERTQKRLKDAADVMERMRLEAQLDQREEELLEYEEYLNSLPEWTLAARHEKYALEVCSYGSYIGYLDQAKGKDTLKAPGSVDLAKLMEIVLPKYTSIEDKENPTGYRKMPPAEFLDKDKGVKPFVAEVLWNRLYLGINPDRSILPSTPSLF